MWRSVKLCEYGWTSDPQQINDVVCIGAIQVLGNVFFLENLHPVTTRNANNIEPYTLAKPFSEKFYPPATALCNI